MNGVALQEVADVKYLRVYLSSDLSWTKHVDAITAKANRVLNFIKRNFKMAPTNIKELLYVTNVRPILEYACPAWDPYYVNLISKLERVQNRAARFVANNYEFCSSITDLKKQLEWKSLVSRRKYLRMKLFRGIYLGQTGIVKDHYLHNPDYLSSRVDHPLKIKNIRCRTEMFKNSYFPKSISDWNSLPQHVVTETSDAMFSTSLLDIL